MSEAFWKIGYLVSFAVWFLVRSIFARPAMKSKTRRKTRFGLEVFLVALNFIGMMFLPLLAALSNCLNAFRINLPDFVRFIALTVSFLNIGLFAGAHKDLGKNWSPVLEVKREHKLIKEGVYKRIRHPMYAHLWLWVAGQGLILDNWIVLAFGVIAWAVLYYSRVPKEEKMLIEEFGQEYREYMKNTGRVFPRFCFSGLYGKKDG